MVKAGWIRTGWFAACWAMALGAWAGRAGADEPPTYEREIKPLFAKRCNVCHNKKNLDNEDVSAGLALDSYEAALAGTEEHKVIDAGHAATSELFTRLSDPDEDRRMPLSEKPLTEAQRTLIGRWIDAGAPRGVAPAVASSAAAKGETKRPARRIVRSLDVIVPAEAKVPSGLEGMGSGGALQLVLKVGPLPAVTTLAFRPDGKQLAVGAFGAVVVWDLETGKPATILGDVPGQVQALAFRRDGTQLAVGAGLPARSGSLQIYALPDGSLVRDLTGHDDVVCGLAFSPDGSRLASASFDQTLRVWPLGEGATGDAGIFRGHSDFVYDVAFSKDGATLLSVSKDRSIKRTDLATLKEKRTYSDHNDDVLALALHPDGTRFVTAGNEPQVRWWEFDGEKPSMKVSGHSGPVHQLAFSGDGKRLISAGADGTVRLWDGTTGVLLRTFSGATEWQYAVAVSGDGRLAAAGGWDGLVRVWDVETGKLRATLLQAPGTSSPPIDWLIAVPSGFADASGSLAPSLRVRVAGREVDDDAARNLFLDAEGMARALP